MVSNVLSDGLELKMAVYLFPIYRCCVTLLALVNAESTGSTCIGRTHCAFLMSLATAIDHSKWQWDASMLGHSKLYNHQHIAQNARRSSHISLLGIYLVQQLHRLLIHGKHNPTAED